MSNKDYSDLSDVDILEKEIILKNLAKALESLTTGYMFALLIFKKDESNRCDYISNAQRDGVINALETTAKRLRNRNG